MLLFTVVNIVRIRRIGENIAKCAPGNSCSSVGGGIAESGALQNSALQGVLENCACKQVKVFPGGHLAVVFWERVLLVLLLSVREGSLKVVRSKTVRSKVCSKTVRANK
jgi:hypothetical protein